MEASIMVDRHDAARAETGVDSEDRREERPAETAGRKLKEISDKVGCAANVALDNYEDHDRSDAHH
jgi:hypothetical protein